LKLQKNTPDDIYYRSLELTGDGELVIHGYADSSASVNTFQSRLIESDDFQNIQLKFSTKRHVFTRDMAEFKIHLKFKQDG